jgi:type IV pilus assembly protein PilE
MGSKAGKGERAMSRVRGFTLIELMIVVVIIAILAAIAIPAYGRYAYRARRPDGQQLLLQIANAQERYYATNNQYGTLGNMGYADPALSEKGYYQVAVVVTADPAGNSSAAFTATATPISAQVSDACGALSINNAGVKLPKTTDAAHNSNGPCW